VVEEGGIGYLRCEAGGLMVETEPFPFSLSFHTDRRDPSANMSTEVTSLHECEKAGVTHSFLNSDHGRMGFFLADVLPLFFLPVSALPRAWLTVDRWRRMVDGFRRACRT
jgi:hypothetical protein